MLCPITGIIKGYPFEVPLPPGFAISGVILADQVRSLDWRIRQAQFIGRLPARTVAEVIGKLLALFAK